LTATSRNTASRRRTIRLPWIAEQANGVVPRFEKVEWEPQADGVTIEGDDL
jgi:hypothetical protein